MQKPKGTYDVYGDLGKQIQYIEKVIGAMMEKYHYEYVRTPIFESKELFHRGVGDSSDIVTKETYDFQDRAGREMTLRPEGTAGVVRSFIENKLYGRATLPVKTWYYGPMFRYERPQAGRYREFYQFGVEVFGSNDPLIDAEIISIPVNIYRFLGLKGIKVKINSLGDEESRTAYKKALKEYFKPHVNELCEDCKVRFEKNPLRMLDCKIDHEKEIMKNAPTILSYLNKESEEHFKQLQNYLKAMEIPFEVDETIVRGLDYYTHTVFEVEADIKEFGSQKVLCGGGRYNQLVETLGGPSTCGVGFAMGMERLLSALEKENITFKEESLDCYLFALSENEKEYVAYLSNLLRMNGFSVTMDYNQKSFKANFKQVERLNPKFVLIIGEEEVKDKKITIKNNHTKKEEKIKEEHLIEYLDEEIEM